MQEHLSRHAGLPALAQQALQVGQHPCAIDASRLVQTAHPAPQILPGPSLPSEHLPVKPKHMHGEMYSSSSAEGANGTAPTFQAADLQQMGTDVESVSPSARNLGRQPLQELQPARCKLRRMQRIAPAALKLTVRRRVCAARPQLQQGPLHCWIQAHYRRHGLVRMAASTMKVVKGSSSIAHRILQLAMVSRKDLCRA